MAEDPNLLNIALVGAIIVLSLYIALSSRRVVRAKEDVKGMQAKVGGIEDEMEKLRNQLAAERRSVEGLASARVRAIDLSSKLWIYSHLLDHLEKWRRGAEDSSMLASMMNNSSERLSRKIKDYWEKIEEEGASASSPLSDTLTNYLKRRVEAFEMELKEGSVPGTPEREEA